MQQSGFRSAPVSQALLYFIVASSLLASILNIKHYFHIQIIPHLWVYRQVWRIFIWQTCYANAGELLFGALVIYHLRAIERLFGTRKYASFLAYCFVATNIAAPLLLAAVFRPLTFGQMNYLPPGPTPILFAALAQYHAVIPGVYKFRLLTSTNSNGEEGPGITLSDKFYVYLLSTQLALCQPPGSLLSVAVGWIVGYAWRMDLLPKSKWRIPKWLFKDSQGAEFENLRRRLREGEGVVDADQGAGQRPLVRQVLDQFRGAF
ncbi:hypothetical protein C7212DRAFT_349875 [Tuber magnatum]|uniref:Peptidase S54 rhomboid domain-containing protein n=1 Tax=Tuber magnatum TaxID=42249 RepID=A0A317SZU3_9PEZI|nr:hypothetical protein C7212DRAFT_349875 [Tuber magnatum]